MKSLFNPFGVDVKTSPSKRFFPALALSILFGYGFTNASGILTINLLFAFMFLAMLPFDKNFYKPFGSKFLIFAGTAFWCGIFFEDSLLAAVCFFISLAILRISQEFFDEKTKTYSWILKLAAFGAVQGVFEPFCFLAKYAGRIIPKEIKYCLPKFLKKLIACLAIFLIGSVFFGLFCVASPQLKFLADVIFEFVLEDFFPNPHSFFPWMFLSWLCFGLFSITAYSSVVNTFKEAEDEMPKTEVFPQKNFSMRYAKTFSTALAIFNAIFLLQNIFDLKYILSGCVLPQGTTYAKFAMDGSFALAIATLLAAAIIIVCFKECTNTKDWRSARILAYVWIAQNIMLGISACTRLASYTSAYGITTTRIYGFAFFAIVFAGFALTAVKIVKNKPVRWLIDANIYSAVALLAAMSLWDEEQFVANYNVNRFLDGNKLDFEYLSSLSDTSAIPAMIKIANANDKKYTPLAKTYLEKQVEFYMSEDFSGKHFNYKYRKTQKILENYFK